MYSVRSIVKTVSDSCLPKWSERLQVTPCALLNPDSPSRHPLQLANPINRLLQEPGIALTMRFSAATLLVSALGWFSAATAHTIQLKSHSRECFHETLHRDDLMTVTFQVGDREFGGSGNLEIDFWV